MIIKNNKNKYFSFVKKQFSKFAVVLVVVSMLFGTLGINQTSAYFSDSVTVSGNTFTAGTLSIDLNNTNTYSSGLLYPTDSTSQSMNISNTGSLSSQYIAKTTLEGSDTLACDSVTMTASSGVYTYTGLIKDFTSDIIPTTNATWNYNFTVSPTAPASVWDKTCFFKWNYTAWQSNLSDSASGFTSVKEKSGSIRIGKAIVLNEILYNPKSTDSAPSNKEFIELYNNSNIAIDVAGWQVSEISGSTEQKYTITTTATPTSHRAVPYSGSTIISPKGWMTLQLSVGNALNDNGDTVRLYDASNNELDKYDYKGGKPEGHSDARIPDGIGDWVDPIPTPGSSNELVPAAIEQPIVKVATPKTQSIIIDNNSITTDIITETTTTDQAVEGDKVKQDTAPIDQVVDSTMDNNEAIVKEPEEVVIEQESVVPEEPKKDFVIEAPVVTVEKAPAVEAEAPAIE